jgi:YVTN family beta-propeller protein
LPTQLFVSAALLAGTSLPAVAQTRAYITHNQSVTAIDVETGTVVGSVPLGTQVSDVAVLPDGSRLYVSKTFTHQIAIIDTASMAITGHISAGADPIGLAISPDGTRLYVEANTVVRIVDTATNAVTATMAVPGDNHAMALSPDGSRLYVTGCNGDNNVRVVNTTSKTVIATVPVGARPCGVAVSPGGARIYVSNSNADSVTVIDAATSGVITTVPVGDQPYGMTVMPDGATLFVANFGGSVSVIATATNSVQATIPVTGTPVDLARSPSGSRVVVPGYNGGRVHIIDSTAKTVVENVTVGGFPDSVAIPIPLVDADGDGLPTDWEARFGLNPASTVGNNGAGGDPDGDGRTNVQEFQAGTHPRGFVTRYLAEGATNTFFDTSLALVNAGSTPASVLLRFLKSDGTMASQHLVVPGNTRRTLRPATLTGLASAIFSTVVESDSLVVLDRTMTWDGSGYGSHAETALRSPSTTWYLAEGSTSSDFNLFYLLQNPNAAAVQASVRYLLPFNQPPVEKSYTLPANSRTTIYVDAEGAALASTDVSGVITADAPIIVERAMYVNKPGQDFGAGHESAGVKAPALKWFLAEGATGPFFDEFVLIANPNASPAHVTAEHLLVGGGVLTKSYIVPANGRFSIWVDDEELPAGSGQKPLANVAVSTTIKSTNSVPVIVERAMWWPGPAISANFWYEAHNSPGATSTGTRWALAEGEVGGPRGLETYILVANTIAAPGQARVTLFFEDGTSTQRTYQLAANSRTNVSVGADFLNVAGKKFGAVVESLGEEPAQIVVERAMYSSTAGAVWSAGTNALATKLQ